MANGTNTNDAGRTTILPAPVRCVIYTRKSTDEGLDQEFNSLDAQREAAEAFIASQRAEGWIALPDRYDDGGFSGGTLERPALQRLMRDVESGKVDVVIVYKVDRLSRSLLDFTRIVDLFDRHKVSFVSVTQHFNTTSSMGRLTLNILLSFAQFEREIIGERIRDKVAAAKRKGKYTGGPAVLGYDVDRVNKRLLVNPTEAKLVRHIFKRFVQIQSTTLLAKELNEAGHRTKSWTTVKGKTRRGNPWDKFVLYRVLNNRLYIGEIDHKGNVYPGEHEAIIAREVWDQAHAIMAENSHSRGGRARSRTPALLRGIIKCGHCGCSMGITWSRRNGRQYRYYHCLSAAKSGAETCPVKSVSAGDMEHAVIEQMRGLFRSPEIIAQTFRTAKALATEGEQPFEETQVARALEHLDALWDTLFPAEQTRIIQLLVSKVAVNTDGLDVAFRLDGLRQVTAEMTTGEEAVA